MTDTDVRFEQAKLNLIASKHVATILSSNFVLPMVVGISIYFLTETHNNLAIWVIAGLAIGVFRLIHMRHLESHISTSHNLSRSYLELAVIAALSGSYWALSLILFVDPENLVLSVLIIITLLGVITGAVSAYAPSFRLVLLFTAFAWIPVGIVFLGRESAFYTQLSILGTIYLVLHTIYGLSHKQSVIEALQLRFENEDLLAELKRQTALAEEANQAKSKFLAAASHDLRQPMHAMGLFADSLEKRIEDPSTTSILNMLKNSLEALRGLLSSLLDISRLDAGSINPEKRAINLNSVLSHLVDEYRMHALEKGIDFRARLQTAWVYSDPNLLEDIFRNLTWNAIKYTQSGAVLMGVRRHNGRISFEVWDTGCGIPKNEIEKIFDEFHQVNNPNRDRSQGLGLGLSIVARLCQLLDLEISVRSEPGAGSKFSVLIPEIEAPIQRDQPLAITTSDENLSGVAVLVVDDEVDILNALKITLGDWGCIVKASSSVKETMSMMEDFSPDILVTDYQLRDQENGTQIIELVREESGFPIPSIIVTGTTNTVDLPEMENTKLLYKPLEPTELKHQMLQMLND